MGGNMKITIEEAVRRIQELNRFSEETGQPLPYRPGFILSQELRGHVVDLEDGSITLNGADARHRPTAAETGK